MANKGFTQTKFIELCKQKHNNNYDYSCTVYTGTRNSIEYECPIHGIVSQQAGRHLSGHGCLKCNHTNVGLRSRLSKDDYIKSLTDFHRERYDYSRTEYKGKYYDIEIYCKVHQEAFFQKPQKHRKFYGCKGCQKEFAKRKLKHDEFIKRCKEKFGNSYDYSNSEYNGSHEPFSFICKDCNKETTKLAYAHENHETGCSFCRKGKHEREINQFLTDELNQQVISNARNILKSGKELDLYIPDLRLAIEHHGNYYHSESNGKDKTYHLNKLLDAEENNIHLLQIFEDEWVYKSDICKSIIRHKCKKDLFNIYARKCVIKEISPQLKDSFLDSNHIQGKDQSKIKLGLCYNEELIAVMTFGTPRYRKDTEWELIRFCVKQNYNIIGGADKLFKHFIRSHNPTSIVSYADRRWSQGKIYNTLGFNLIATSKPSYYYINKKNYLLREHRSNYTKDKIKIKFHDADLSKTEEDLMLDYGYDRIWDCGTYTFIWKKENP